MSQGSARALGVGATGATGATGPVSTTPGPTGPSGGTIVYTGNAILNFGSAPGANTTSVVVTGQTEILTTSTVQCFIMGDTTVSGATGHNVQEHEIVPIVVSATSLVAGTGFTITAFTDWRLTSTFEVRYSWTQ
jgi:hypothetical protein